MRTCRKCNKEKSLDRFGVRATTTGPRLRWTCKDCINESNRLRRDDRRRQWEKAYYDRKRANGGKPLGTSKVGIQSGADVLARDRDWRFRTQYGISLAEYEERYAELSGRCEICNKGFEKLYVDHDHSTGKFRGLLCRDHNLALGGFGDKVDYLLAAINYLEKP